MGFSTKEANLYFSKIYQKLLISQANGHYTLTILIKYGFTILTIKLLAFSIKKQIRLFTLIKKIGCPQFLSNLLLIWKNREPTAIAVGFILQDCHIFLKEVFKFLVVRKVKKCIFERLYRSAGEF